jgi:hypothetical protein
MSSRTDSLTFIVALAALLAAGAHAQPAPLPPVQRADGIEYLSGGIGKDEAHAIEQVSKRWPLTLEFAVQDGKHADFTTGVHVRVRDAKNQTVLQATADGPYLLARLQPGRYTVDAERQGQTRHERVAIASQHGARAVFVWPAAKLPPHA